MKKWMAVLTCLIVNISAGNCQYYFYDATRLEPEWRHEIGISAGLMNAFTDLGGKAGIGKRWKDLDWKTARPAYALSFASCFRDLFSLSVQLVKGKITAADSTLKNDRSEGRLRYLRNLHFTSQVYEGSLLLEGYPFGWFTQRSYSYNPYLIAGIAIFHFQPKAVAFGHWVKLQPLHTEGEGFPEYPERKQYSLVQLALPVGIGIKRELSALAILKLEALYRFLFTDYLDDVSSTYIDPDLFEAHLEPSQALLAKYLADRNLDSGQTTAGAIRGNRKKNNSYFTFMVKLGFVLNRRRIR